jgi:hypothetical protein
MPDRSSTSAGASQHRKCIDFSSLDGRSVTLILRQEGRQILWLGTAEFQRDDALGNVLVITPKVPQVGDARVILRESDWKGRIIPDLEYGSELCIIPAG